MAADFIRARIKKLVTSTVAFSYECLSNESICGGEQLKGPYSFFQCQGIICWEFKSKMVRDKFVSLSVQQLLWHGQPIRLFNINTPFTSASLLQVYLKVEIAQGFCDL